MSETKSFFRRNWRTVVTIFSFALLGIILFAGRDQFETAYKNLSTVNLWWIAAVAPLQWLNFHAYALMYRHFFEILGHKIAYMFMFRTTLELNFVNHVLPSGGVSGFSYFSIAMKQKRVSTSKSTLVQTMRFVFTFISFLVMLFVALLFLGVEGRANNYLLLVAASTTTLLVVGTLLIVYIIGTKRRINAFFTFITKIVNKVIQVARPKHPETININKAKDLFNEFHDDYMMLKRDFNRLKPSFWHGIIVNATELLTIYVVFLAFGVVANFGVIVLAYAVANFAGLISPLPGGAGAYEALMVGVLTAGGIPVAIGFPVVIMFRVVTLVLQLPIGGYWYHNTLQSLGREHIKT